MTSEEAPISDDPVDEIVSDDDPAMLEDDSRALVDRPAAYVDEVESDRRQETRREDGAEEPGDSDSVPDESVPPSDAVAAQSGAWDRTWSAARIGLELQRVEAELRAVLEERDPKRKRKFSGTRRWTELEEDVSGWHGSDRFDAEVLARIKQLIAMRHSLFRRLKFLAGTRPTWNS